MRCLTSGLRDLTALHELNCIQKKARQLERKENVALRHVFLEELFSLSTVQRGGRSTGNCNFSSGQERIKIPFSLLLWPMGTGELSLRTADVFPVVASLPPKGTTGNTSAVRRLRRTLYQYISPTSQSSRKLHNYHFTSIPQFENLHNSLV